MPRNQYKCPRCGNPEKFTRNHEDDLRDNLVICNKCGQQGMEKLFLVMTAHNPFLQRNADGYFSDNADQMPSNRTDGPCTKGNPTRLHERKTDKKRRKDAPARLNPKIDPTEDENTRRVSTNNQFLKKKSLYNDETIESYQIPNGFDESFVDLLKEGMRYIVRRIMSHKNLGREEDVDGIVSIATGDVVNSLNMISKGSGKTYWEVFGINFKGIEKILRDFYQHAEYVLDSNANGKNVEEISAEKNNKNRRVSMSNPFTEKESGEEVVAQGNPFLREARDFKRTKQQLERKKNRNMVFPEGEQNLEDSDGKKLNQDDESSVHGRYRKFDTVDRKDYHNSPDPEQIIPGYKEWKDREVDSYYDGWVDDHIENSGGSVPGSNTEKTMNLNEGERAHAPEFPTEAVYEKHLETRHHFDKGETMVAGGNSFLKKAQTPNSYTNDGLLVMLNKITENFVSSLSEEDRNKLAASQRDEELLSSLNEGAQKILQSSPTFESLNQFPAGLPSQKVNIRSFKDNPFLKKAQNLLDQELETIDGSIKVVNDYLSWIIEDLPKITTQNHPFTRAQNIKAYLDSVVGSFNIVYETLSAANQRDQLGGDEDVHPEVLVAEESPPAVANKDNPFLREASDKKKTKKRNSKARNEWWMSGPSSGVGDAGGDGGAAASCNPFVRKAYQGPDQNETGDNVRTLMNSFISGDSNADRMIYQILLHHFMNEEGVQAKTNPLTKEAGDSCPIDKEDFKAKTEDTVRTPMCPKKKDKGKDKEEKLIHTKGNELFMCPSTGEVFHGEGNNFGTKQPEWKNKKK